jgi:type I restriction-modification system DNA methylase subunit
VVEEFIMLDKYIKSAGRASTHPAKLTVISELLREIFNVKLEDLLPGIEKKIGSKILGVRGSIDLLYSNVIFEIKVDLERELDDAKEKLKKYFQAMLEAHEERPVGIATDVINYKAFLPVIENGVVRDVKEISSINISRESTESAILWLDSYIFSKPKIRPTANDLKFRFGPGSPTYAITVSNLRSLWDLVKDEGDAKLKYELWSKNMEIVYGSKPEINAFIDQTYLVTLVKLMVYLRLSGDNIITNDNILNAVTGKFFIEHGIANLVEEDFFTWITHRKILNESLRLVSSLAKELLRYDLLQIDEDFFKEIYQEIVERGQRHRVGEYYTPEWLTELILKEVISLWEEQHSEPPKILDPACGSGTFLCNSIRILKEELTRKEWKPTEILNYILANIIGVDVNPLAVVIARANYLIALGELLHAYEGSILLPVYAADSIKLPGATKTLIEDVTVYEYTVDNTHLQIPRTVAEDRVKLSKVITAFKEAMELYKVRKNRDNAYRFFERMLQNVVNDKEFRVLKSTLNNILTLTDNGRNSIWVYMLSNIYIPIALSESKFDIVVGNPPWIAMRYIENKEYQDFIKNQFMVYELLDSEDVKLFTHIEVATLFFSRTSDLYLKDGGIIGFVMPRSVLTGAQQHTKFREFKKPSMKLIKILDLENVIPLFNVPSCVLIAVKGGKTSYPVMVRKFSSNLPEKNLKLNEALQYLRANDDTYQPPQILLRKSPYYNKIKAGATIVPRCLWFVELIIHPTFGINLQTPYCRTSEDILKNAKEPWKDIKIEGRVEKDFIYATALSTDLIPFGCNLRTVVLPIKLTTIKHTLQDTNTLRNNGFPLMAEWLEKAQKIWEDRRTEKADKRFPTILDRLDYNNLLSIQNPGKRYIVIYNSSGTNIASCVIDRQKLQPSPIDKTISYRGFVAEVTTMFYETNNESEAHYLCAVLNSDVVNKAIKPLQPRGLFGERHIIRRPFMLPIPEFNPNDPIHKRLAELSKICHDKVAGIKLANKSVAGKRKSVREILKGEIEEINNIVSQLLNLG